MKPKFILIVHTVSAVSPSGRHLTESNRRIELVSGTYEGFVANALLRSNMDPLTCAVSGNTFYSGQAPDPDGSGWFNSYHFTAFDASEVPHYAKQLSKQELQTFIDHAEENGIVFLNKEAEE